MIYRNLIYASSLVLGVILSAAAQTPDTPGQSGTSTPTLSAPIVAQAPGPGQAHLTIGPGTTSNVPVAQHITVGPTATGLQPAR